MSMKTWYPICLVATYVISMLTPASAAAVPRAAGGYDVAAPAALGKTICAFCSNEMRRMATRLDQVERLGFANRAMFSSIMGVAGFAAHRQTPDELLEQTSEQGSEKFRKMEDTLAKMENELRQLKQQNTDLRISSGERNGYFKAVAGKLAPKSCDELRKLGLAESGKYLIDPDGAGVGEDPISVFCEMTQATNEVVTRIGHNLEIETVLEVENCQGPGCGKTHVTYNVRYNAPMKQIRRLIEISGNCAQSIQYNCFSAPLTKTRYPSDPVHKGSWTGADGTRNYYWDGSHSPKDHVCACKSLGTCSDEDHACNCDSPWPSSAVWKTDAGVLTNQTALPVVELTFERLLAANSQAANFTLGDLLCSSPMTMMSDGNIDQVSPAAEERNCLDIEFRCGDGTCIDANWVCDGAHDCNDGLDEKSCSMPDCQPPKFRCANGNCLSAEWRCDGDNDCRDESDELDCPPRTARSRTKLAYCGASEWQCNSGDQCVEKLWLCDGEPECKDESDESKAACPFNPYHSA